MSENIHAEPTAAERVSSGECTYDGCNNNADYRVQIEFGPTTLMCDSCSRTNRVWVKENELLKSDIQE